MSLTPELLSPAGSLDKLKTALAYGADAVYLAGQKYGLRSAAENFTLDELEEGVDLAHRGRLRNGKRAKVYVVINSFVHDGDFIGLREFLRDLQRLHVDGIIASDLGVIRLIAETTTIPIHLSTQASCLNDSAGRLWKEMGVKRLILGRESSIEDAGRIKRSTGLEVELFIHGSMCMAYSGNCTISNYTQGRDSNRGGCAQSCRFSYTVDIEQKGRSSDGHNQVRLENTFFMSSKDLLGIDLLPKFFEQEIDSIKIEGRMRSPMYAGVLSKTYREAIDLWKRIGPAPSSVHAQEWTAALLDWHSELAKVPRRESMTGSLLQPADLGSTLTAGNPDLGLPKPHGFQSKIDSSRDGASDFLGLVRKVAPNSYLLVDVKNPFDIGAKLEVLPFSGKALEVSCATLHDSVGEAIPKAKVSHLVRIPFILGAEVGNLVRLSAPAVVDQPLPHHAPIKNAVELMS